jgi:hypothetical protein
MFFSMMLMLAIASTMVEAMFAAKIPLWRQLAHKYKWFNMTISILLSFILGFAFGAQGLIALGAAVISTVLSVPAYAMIHWNYDTPSARAHGGSEFRYYSARFKASLAKWKVALSDLAKLTYTIIRTITFPIWVTRAAYTKIKPYIQRFNAWTDARRASRSLVP